MVKNMKGYKVFRPDWSCRGFQYEVGKTYVEDVKPKCCSKGFHFCKDLKDCFNYYSFNIDNKVAEVTAIGDIDEEQNDSKCCTNKIQIIREISWEEVLKMVNIGKGNTGYCNSGDWNSGNHNSGNHNSGNHNSGNYNSGYYNSGYYNSGNWNSGNYNSGNYNSGNYNSGYYNSGDWNSGDWNKTNYSSGCFNTLGQKMVMFNKPSSWTYNDWTYSTASYLLDQIPKNVVEWIYSDDMTEEEKAAYPEHETTGGYLKVLDEKECGQIWWDNLCEQNKNVIKELPNFDASIFKEITGIDVSCK